MLLIPAKAGRSLEFEVSLVYMMSFRTLATQRNLLKNNQKKVMSETPLYIYIWTAVTVWQ